MSSDEKMLARALLWYVKRERMCPFCGWFLPPCIHVGSAQRIVNAAAGGEGEKP